MGQSRHSVCFPSALSHIPCKNPVRQALFSPGGDRKYDSGSPTLILKVRIHLKALQVPCPGSPFMPPVTSCPWLQGQGTCPNAWDFQGMQTPLVSCVASWLKELKLWGTPSPLL